MVLGRCVSENADDGIVVVRDREEAAAAAGTARATGAAAGAPAGATTRAAGATAGGGAAAARTAGVVMTVLGIVLGMLLHGVVGGATAGHQLRSRDPCGSELFDAPIIQYCGFHGFVYFSVGLLICSE